MNFIASRLHRPGWINRRHLMEKFRISQPQASADIQVFQRINPGAMDYDLSKKRYVRA